MSNRSTGDPGPLRSLLRDASTDLDRALKARKPALTLEKVGSILSIGHGVAYGWPLESRSRVPWKSEIFRSKKFFRSLGALKELVRWSRIC